MRNSDLNHLHWCTHNLKASDYIVQYKFTGFRNDQIDFIWSHGYRKDFFQKGGGIVLNVEMGFSKKVLISLISFLTTDISYISPFNH